MHIHWPGRCRSPHGASWTSSVDQWGNPQPYWFGGSLGKGTSLIAIPSEGNPAPPDALPFLPGELREGTRWRSINSGMQSGVHWFWGPLRLWKTLRSSTLAENPMSWSIAVMERVTTYNEEDEEDESQTGYWIKCLPRLPGGPQHLGALLLNWAYQTCHDLLLQRWRWTLGPCPVHGAPRKPFALPLSRQQQVFCFDHRDLPKQEMTPPRQMMPVKRVPMKMTHRKAPVSMKMTPAKKSFLRKLLIEMFVLLLYIITMWGFNCFILTENWISDFFHKNNRKALLIGWICLLQYKEIKSFFSSLVCYC